MKRVVSIQDISCLGKCSLTVALPIISAMGVETCVVPTAVLSTHTGGFKNFTFHDLTQEIDPISDHWANENIHFDAIYTGYLGSFEQIDLVGKFFDRFGGDGTLVYADPAMADNGVLYPGFTPEFAKKMGELCGKADVIVPNLTVASFMLGISPFSLTMPAREAVPTRVPMVSNMSIMQKVRIRVMAVNQPIWKKPAKSNLKKVRSIMSAKGGAQLAVLSPAKGSIPRKMASPAQ